METSCYTLEVIIRITAEVGEDWAIARLHLERMKTSLQWLGEESFGVL